MEKAQIKNVKREEDFDFKKIVARVLDHWKLYVICVVAFLILGFLFNWYAAPMYNVYAKILVQDDQGKESTSLLGSSALQDFSGLFDMPANVNNELAILNTRDLIEKVVRQNQLNVKYFQEEGIKKIEKYKKSPFTVDFVAKNDSFPSTYMELEFTDLGKGNSITVQYENEYVDTAFTANFDVPVNTSIGKITFHRSGLPFEDANYGVGINTITATVFDIQSNLTAEITNPETTVIDLSYKTNVPLKGEDILNSLIDVYTKRNLSEKNRISDSSISFINSRISIVSDELKNIEGNIQQFKQSNDIADLTEQSRLLVNNASTYYDKLNELDVKLNVTTSMLNYLKDQNNNKRPVPALINDDPTFLALVQRYNALLVEQDRTRLSLSEINPITKNLQTQINNVRSDLIKSLENQVAGLKISRAKLVSENKVFENMINSVPGKERAYISLSRDQNVKQALYLYLLQKREETSITEASTISNATTIQAPKSSYKPYFPQTSVILAVSIFLGLFVASAYMILKYNLNNRIISSESIKEATDCPVLAEIGHSDKAGLLSMKEEGRSILVEQFRTFRTNMSFITGQKKCPTILVTSLVSGEGKSFVAANLAQVYAYSGKKVLLLELDLRKPHILNMLGIKSGEGFTNLLVAEGRNVEKYIQPVPGAANLFIIGSGSIPPNPAELLMLPVVDDLFAKFKNDFDLVVIDSPPIGLVTDAQILSKYSDVNLFIVRERYSFKNSMDVVNNLIENDQIKNLYLVVNDVQKGASYKYGYGYGYGYGYNYGYGSSNGHGYYDVKKKKKRSGKKLGKLFSKS